MRIRAVGSPSGTGSSGGTVSGGSVVVVASGSSVVLVVLEVVVVVGRSASVSASVSANWSSRRFWAWASLMPVPHSWYATKSRISTPAVMNVRPTAPRTLANLTPGGYRAGSAALVAS